jgi:hypothetical protein
MQDAIAIQLIETKYRSLFPLRDERLRRPWAAAEADAYGWGGVVAVAPAPGRSPTTIRKGHAELLLRFAPPRGQVAARVRRPGAGRKAKTEEDPDLGQALEKLGDPLTRGDRPSPLRWTCKSTRTLARELPAQGHGVSERVLVQFANRRRARACLEVPCSGSQYSLPNLRSACSGGTEGGDSKLPFLDVVDELDPRDSNGGVSKALKPQGKRASSAGKTKELGQIGNGPAGLFALDFQRAFPRIPPQQREGQPVQERHVLRRCPIIKPPGVFSKHHI